jgi:hypothetical protein
MLASGRYVVLPAMATTRAPGARQSQQGCDVAKVIDTVEQAVSTAKKVYRVIEPVVNAFTNRPKTK